MADSPLIAADDPAAEKARAASAPRGPDGQIWLAWRDRDAPGGSRIVGPVIHSPPAPEEVVADAAADPDRIIVAYEPRGEFVPLHERDERWAVAVAHRRAGKTVARVNELIPAAAGCARPIRASPASPPAEPGQDIAWQYLSTTAPSSVRAGRPRHRAVGRAARQRARIRSTAPTSRPPAWFYLDGAVLDEYGDMDRRPGRRSSVRPCRTARLPIHRHARAGTVSTGCGRMRRGTISGSNCA